MGGGVDEWPQASVTVGAGRRKRVAKSMGFGVRGSTAWRVRPVTASTLPRGVASLFQASTCRTTSESARRVHASVGTIPESFSCVESHCRKGAITVVSADGTLRAEMERPRTGLVLHQDAEKFTRFREAIGDAAQ